MVQAVAAEVEQLEVFGQQELFGPEMFDGVSGQIHLIYVRWQFRRDVFQICKEGETKKDKERHFCNRERGWKDRVHIYIDQDEFLYCRCSVCRIEADELRIQSATLQNQEESWEYVCIRLHF